MWIGLIGLFIVGMLGGFTPVMLKFGLQEFPPLFLTVLRFLIASIVFLPFFLKQKKHLTQGDIWYLFTRSIFFAGNVGFFSIAVQYTTAIVSQIIYTLVPVIVLVMSYVFLKEKLTMPKIFGLIIATIGIGLLIQQSITKTETLTFGTPLGNILTLCAVLSWSFYVIVSKDLTKRFSLTVTTFSSFITTIFILFLLLPIEYIIRPWEVENITTIGIGSVLGLGVFSSAIMFFLKQFIIKKVGPFPASFSEYLGPFSSALFAIPLLGEKPTITLFFAGMCIIFGVVYATSYEQIKKHVRSVLQ